MYYYYVIMQGILVQELQFITEDVHLAKEKAEVLAKADSDDYHSWDVYIYHRETDESHLYYEYNKKSGSRYTIPGERTTEWVKFS